MLKKLIVNADDYGMTEANTISTILCHIDGILTSTTMMVNMPFAEYGAKLAKDYPTLGIGIHLVLTMGRPLVEGAKSYTDENGDFRRPNTYEKHMPCADPNELYTEWKAQIEKFIEIMGKKPTHIDSHHHVHMEEAHLPIALKLAKEYDVPLRLKKEIDDYDFQFAKLIPNFYDSNATINYFLDMNPMEVEDEICELMCHPSFLDDRLLSLSSYAKPRTIEMVVLRSQEVKSWIKEKNIELINFTDLKK